MECSICNKESSYLLAIYKNNGKLDYFEARCKDHQNLGLKKERKHRKEKRKGKK